MSPVTPAPTWVRRIVREEIRAGEQMLMDAMLTSGEDITNTALWRQRKSQFMHLLIQQAVKAKAATEDLQD